MAEEKNFENRIKKHLTDRGHWSLKYWAGSRYTKAGIPDLICCINGRFVAIEVKAERGKVSEIQKYHIDQINDAGGWAFSLRPSQWEKFTAFVADMEHKGCAEWPDEHY